MLTGGPSTEPTPEELKIFAEIDLIEAKGENKPTAAYEPYKDYLPAYNQHKARIAKAAVGITLNQENASVTGPKSTNDAKSSPRDMELVASIPLANVPLNRDMIAAAKERELKRKEDEQKDAADKKNKKAGCCSVM